MSWNVSQPSVDIGDVTPGIQKNSSPDEFIITVETVGAPFTLTMSGAPLGYTGTIITHWTGTG